MSKRIIRDGRGLEIPERQIAEQLSSCGLNERAFYAATEAQDEHFTCEHCQLRYKRTGFHDHVGDTDEEIVPLCGSCYALFLEEAKKQGYKINDIGGLEEQ